MSGGGSKTEYVTSNRTTEPAAFIKPFLEYGANEAQRLYQSELPSYFPQSTVVGFAPQQEMALRGIEQRALAVHVGQPQAHRGDQRGGGHEQDADQRCREHHQDPGVHRLPGAVENHAVQVSAEVVRAEPVDAGGPLQPVREDLLIVTVRGEHGGERCGAADDHEDHEGDEPPHTTRPENYSSTFGSTVTGVTWTWSGS